MAMGDAHPIFPDDPFGGIKAPVARVSPPPEVVARFHARSDVDSNSTAQHHTLGVKHDQASPGDHKHTGDNSLLIMEGITVAGDTAGNLALQDLIAKLADALGFTDATT